MFRLIHIRIDCIMNRIGECRSGWRKVIREQQLTSFKKNIRNLIFYQQTSQTTIYDCSLCREDRWIYQQDPRHIVQLVLAIFHENHLCSAHIEAFFSKALECLRAEPSIYSQLICGGGRQRRELVYRKILLLLEIFDNQLLLQEEGLWFEIEKSFKGRGEFMVKLMDCAYSFGQWPVEDLEDENWDTQVKSICYSSVLNIFGKFPLLFHCYLEEYSINILLQKSKGKKRVDLLHMLRNIVSYSQEKSHQFEATVYFLFIGFKSYLRDIKQMQHSLEVFEGKLELFITFAVGWKFIDEESICYVVCLIKNNKGLHTHASLQIYSVLQFVNQNYHHNIDENSLKEIEYYLNKIGVNAYEKSLKTDTQSLYSYIMQTE